MVAKRTVVKQQEGKLVYIVKNDPYAKGLDGTGLLNRLPRVSVDNGTVSVAGKGTVRYIIDGVLMELDASAMASRLQNLRAENIEKIELLTTPPSRYAVEPNAAYISITTRNESLGTRGNIYGSLNCGKKLREYFSGSINHTTRHIELALDVNLSNYYANNDNDIEYRFDDRTRRSITTTDTHLFNSGVNALFRYRITPDMKIGAIANYNYEASTSDGINHTDYGTAASSSQSHTKSRPNNALTLTGFFDCALGDNGQTMELTYNFFNRHHRAGSLITTSYNDNTGPWAIDESGTTGYRFHSGKADFKFPKLWAQLEAGIGYTDILNTSDNLMQSTTPAGSASLQSTMFDYKERIAAAYITAARTLGAGFWGKAGLRYEYTRTESREASLPEAARRNYGRLFPTLNVSWSNGHSGNFNLSYSMGMGRPNLWELNPFRYYSTTDEYAAGNPDLKPTVYHNAELNYYGLSGLYAVLYTSFASDGIGYIRSLDSEGILSTMPYNCLSTNKTGLYANYKRSFFGRWEMNAGGEIFHTYAHTDMESYRRAEMDDWSGKIELSTNLMLTRSKNLIFGARFTHLFPWQQNLIRYEALQMLNFSLRYSLLGNRLNLQLTANDIFGWNKTRSKEHYSDYTIRQTFNAHSAYVLFGISYRFGRDKVNSVYRQSKEEHSKRTK